MQINATDMNIGAKGMKIDVPSEGRRLVQTWQALVTDWRLLRLTALIHLRLDSERKSLEATDMKTEATDKKNQQGSC